jgi:hypothetical protein
VVDRGVIDDPMAQKRPILHEPEHGIPPGSVALSLFLLRCAEAGVGQASVPM